MYDSLGMQKQANSYIALPSWGWGPVGEMHTNQITLNSLQRREQPTGEERQGSEEAFGEHIRGSGLSHSHERCLVMGGGLAPLHERSAAFHSSKCLHTLAHLTPPSPPAPTPHRREGNRGP